MFFLIFIIFFFSKFNFYLNLVFTYLIFVLLFFVSFVFLLYHLSLFFNLFVLNYFLFLNFSSFLFFKVVLIICFFVLFYIFIYFFFFDNLFIFIITFFVFFISILLYLISFNIILIFLFWEMMGLCSFFLISSFFFRFKTRFSSFLAFFWNLLGDLFLLFFLIINFIYLYFINLLVFFFFFFFFFLICFAIFCKSAVYPFHSWLYYAMEGPTPVSAFLHAASMITAGVYFFFMIPVLYYNFLFILFGVFTTIFFSLNAFNFFDIKRIIASSTGSQLGYIYFFLTFNLIFCGLLLFTFHSFFKSILFFVAGFIISIFFNYQDLRLFKNNFFIFIITLICFFSLIGIFFFWCGLLKEIFLSFSFNNSLIIFIFILFFILSFYYFLSFYNKINIIFNYFNIIYILLFLFFIISSFIFINFVFNIFFFLVLPKYLYFFTLCSIYISVVLIFFSFNFYDILYLLVNYIFFFLILFFHFFFSSIYYVFIYFF